MNRYFYLLFFLFISFLYGEQTDHSPFHSHDKRHLRGTTIQKPAFQGLVLVSKESDLNPAGYETVHGVQTVDVTLPGNIVSLKKELRTLIGKSLDASLIKEIKKRVTAFYCRHHRPFVTLTVPEQDISSGTLQLIVKISRIGKIEVKGNKWFSKKSIEESIQLEEDEMVAADLLDQDLYWLNRNPFRQVDALFLPGKDPNTTDIELQVHDRFPLRTYTGIDNTGNDVTGNNRFFVGLDSGQLFKTDQRLSYQFVSSTDFKRFYSHVLFYELPLPWRHLLQIYGGYGHVDASFRVPDIQGTKFHTKGWSMQTSLRYDIPLKPLYRLLHEFIWGFDFKRTNNNLDLGGPPIISENNVNLAQFMVGYNLGYDVAPVTLSFALEGYASPGEWIADQSDSDYQSLRPFSKNRYVYARSAFTLVWDFFEKWTFHQAVRWQWASINLLPSEEYGVGGYNTVRGYKERLVNGDNVFILNLEVHTPKVSLLYPLLGHKKFQDTFEFLLFFDYGFQQVKQPVYKQNKTNNLASVGPGIRYQVSPYLTLRVDWGFQLHHLTDPSINPGPHQRLHFALIGGY